MYAYAANRLFCTIVETFDNSGLMTKSVLVVASKYRDVHTVRIGIMCTKTCGNILPTPLFCKDNVLCALHVHNTSHHA
jgi:hypothetical protein